MVQKTKKNPLQRLISRLKRKKAVMPSKGKPFASNTAVLNNTPKNHKPSKRKIVQK